MANYSDTDVAMARVLADFVVACGYTGPDAVDKLRVLCVVFDVAHPRVAITQRFTLGGVTEAEFKSLGGGVKRP